MKKLLVLISLILCFSMLFTACASKTQDEELGQVEDNVEANVDMLVDWLNRCETVDQILNTTTETVDYEQLIAELKKVSAQGSVTMSATENGEDQGTIGASIAIKDNTFSATAENVDDEKVGAYGSISEDLKLSFAVWEKDEDYSDAEAIVIDIKSVMDEVMAMAEEGMSEEMPIDLSDIKLPKFTKESIKYEDGKYVLDKNFLYDAIMVTVDSFIDSAKNEGLITDDYDETIDEIKDMAKDVVDAVDFKLYYLITGEQFEGIGVTANVKMADLADAIGEEVVDYEYIKVAFEATNTSTKGSVEYKDNETNYVNKISYNVKFLFDGKNVCGLDATYDIDVKSYYNYESNSDYYYDKSESTDITKQSVKVKFDLSKFDEANATVLDATISVFNDHDYISEYKYGNEPAQNNSYHRISETTIKASLKTTEANKADLVVEYANDYTRTDEDGTEKDTDTMKITGTVEFTTKDVTVPAPSQDVKDAIADAEIFTSVEDFGAQESYPEENYPMTPDYSEDDYYYGEVTTMAPEEEW